MPISDQLSIKPVDIENWSDFEALFSSKGAPSYCWCMAWRLTKEELKNNTSANRKKFIKGRVREDVPIGLLCYIGGEPIGWCSVAPRETHQRLAGDETIEKVWSITCFYIKKQYRNNGLVNILIRHATEYAKSKGAKFLEAYPVESDSPSYRFMGFKETFTKAKFKFIKMAGTRRHVMVRKI